MNKESAGKNKGKIEGKKLFKLLTCTKYILVLITVFPSSLDPFYIVSDYINWVKTS